MTTEGKIAPQEAEWVEVRPKRMQNILKQVGEKSYKMDLDKNLRKKITKEVNMATPMNFPTNPCGKNLRR